MTYQIIYADPPWSYTDKCHAGKRGAGYKYTVPPLEQLCELPVEAIAARDCLLAMWWVAPMPLEALKLVNAWGFTLKTMKGFTWRKLSSTGKFEHFGMGSYTRCNTEDCLFAVRGKPRRINASVRQLITAPVREHSRKPDQARERLVDLMGDVPRIELFARRKFPGWKAYGLDVQESVKLNRE